MGIMYIYAKVCTILYHFPPRRFLFSPNPLHSGALRYCNTLQRIATHCNSLPPPHLETSIQHPPPRALPQQLYMEHTQSVANWVTDLQQTICHELTSMYHLTPHALNICIATATVHATHTICHQRGNSPIYIYVYISIYLYIYCMYTYKDIYIYILHERRFFLFVNHCSNSLYSIYTHTHTHIYI